MAEGLLTLDDGTAIALRRSGRARRMVLRVGRSDGRVALTLPLGVSLEEARRFVARQAGWLERQRAAAPGLRMLAEGAAFPVAGQMATITAAPGLRAARLEGAHLLVPANGAPGPAVAGFLRARARAALAESCARHVAALGPARRFTGLSLRDTRSRWGSCSMAGRLMFSWRLAMAPPPVLDYVAAHEVAHLRHMDHSAAFWAAVAALMPDHAPNRAWLRRHGAGLLAWRFDAPLTPPPGGPRLTP